MLIKSMKTMKIMHLYPLIQVQPEGIKETENKCDFIE